MPEEGVPLQPSEQLLSADEIVRIVSVFASEGVNKIRFTGGEPTIRKDVVEIVSRVAAIEGIDTVAMTSNAIALFRKLPALAAGGLNVVNISLDTLDEDKYTIITRRKGLHVVRKTIFKALEMELEVKVNCVVMKGINDDEVLDFVALAQDFPIQVRFIEYMPFDGNPWSTKRMVSSADLLAAIRAGGYPIVPNHELPNETSKMYSAPTMVGAVGFISSMSDHFCGSCNRLRLMADGNLKVCLFGQTEVSLRDLIRADHSDAEVKTVIAAAVQNKRAAHDGMEALEDSKSLNRPMVLIGG